MIGLDIGPKSSDIRSRQIRPVGILSLSIVEKCLFLGRFDTLLIAFQDALYWIVSRKRQSWH